jgi:hypothetical protein
MESTAFSLEAATKSLREDGLDLNEPTVGDPILGMEQRGFQHLSLLLYSLIRTYSGFIPVLLC